jgi:hypothetical protein
MDLFPVICNLGLRPGMRMLKLSISTGSQIYLLDFAFECRLRSRIDPVIILGHVTSCNVGICLEAALESVRDQLVGCGAPLALQAEYELASTIKHVEEKLDEVKGLLNPSGLPVKVVAPVPVKEVDGKGSPNPKH